MAVASRAAEVNVTFRTRTLVGAFLIFTGYAASTAAQIVVGYPGPVWSRGAYDVSSSLRIEAKPRETEVYVDGYYAGKVDDFDGRFQRLRVEPGEHDIQLYLSGHRLFTQKVYLQPGGTFNIRHTMETLGSGEPEPEKPVGVPRTGPPPAADRGRGAQPRRGGAQPRGGAEPPSESLDTYGRLAIRVQPADAEVFIDGNKWDAPGNQQLLLRLEAGTHRVEVRHDGYRGYLTEVTIKGGEETPLNVALTKQP